MRIIVDLQAIQNNSRARGIGRCARNLFRALAKHDGIELFALLNSAFTTNFDEDFELVANEIGKSRIIVFSAVTPADAIETGNSTRRTVSESLYEDFLAGFDFEALIVISLFEGFEDQTTCSLKGTGSYSKFVVVHDLIPLLNREAMLGWEVARNWYDDRLNHLRHADGGLCVSNSARGELIEHLGFPEDRCVAMGSGIEETFLADRKKKPSKPKITAIKRPYVMHMSAIEERKNFEGLIRAFAKLPASTRLQHQLVLVGGGPSSEIERLKNIGLEVGLSEEDIVFTGFVPDSTLTDLYRACELFVFPSFHEGFGLPPLEAMASGAPTIGSNVTSIPEVIGRDDLMFDPYNIDEISGLMASLLSDPEKRREAANYALQRAKQFRWSDVAARAVDFIKTRRTLAETRRSATHPSIQRTVSRLKDKLDAVTGNFDFGAAGNAVVTNHNEQIRVGAHDARQQLKSWRIEGPFDSSYSLSLVNRETARALGDLGFEVQLHSTEGPGDFEPSGVFLSNNPDLALLHRRATEMSGKAEVCSRLLYPPRATSIPGRLKAFHHYAWEETGFPHAWAEAFNGNLDFLTVLSEHVRKLLIDNGVHVPMAVSGAGVDHWERIVADPSYNVEAKRFRFLHVSSCFPRKGVDRLLEAYGKAFASGDDVSLVIKTFENPHNDIARQLENLRTADPDYPDVVLIFDDLSDSELKSLYGQCHVLVAPSRAEGYGIPLAEAMLSGVPVITTNWSGQLDFCNVENSWLVDYRFAQAETHFGLCYSAWADPCVDSLVGALLEAYRSSAERRREMAEAGRRELLPEHSWNSVAKRLASATRLASAREPFGRPVKIGWVTTWRSKCGIATYSEHLSAHVDAEVTVFSPVNEDVVSSDDNSIRCWQTSKDDSQLAGISGSKAFRDLDVLVIQFNFAFYNHRDLCKLIERAKALGKKVIVMMHATVHPDFGESNEDWNLRFIAAGLRKCDRLLVHSINDLNRLKDLGLTDNVALFPHGALIEDTISESAQPSLVATYGFALPHKGLPEIVEAIAILRSKGNDIRLRMVNAQHPASVSEKLCTDIRKKVKELGLQNYVETHFDFLSDEQSLSLLREASLIVYPYQSTAESASGAVRYGMAVNRPVVVTPLPIFSDLSGAVFALPGTSPAEIASGLERNLSEIRCNSEHAQKIARTADAWRRQHDYRVVGKRLSNIVRALLLS